jgi:DNA-directed RNA polymerase sigma subunit (sigma70/sigma32)
MERGVTIWGHADKTERNVAAVTAALRGKTLAAAGAEVGLTAERVRQLVAKYCRIAWRRDETLQRDFRSMASKRLSRK